jgi:CRISPR system Cascade subunit CasE
MYLSRLILNPRNPGVRRDVARPYGLHRTLMRGIEHAPNDERLLFRIEPERGLGGPVVLAQSSDMQPDWSSLLENAYLLRADGPKAFSPTLQAGQTLRFRLSANPVKKLAGKRIPLTHRIQQNAGDKTYWDWLHRQSDRCGFRVLQAQDVPFRTASNRTKKSSYAKHEIPHFGVRFDGLLRVVDPDRLLLALQQGIGPAKAFGFGLLSLAPAR